MKNYKKILWYVFFLIGSITLSILVRVEPKDVKIGIHCGECVQHCFDIYRLTGSKIEIDSTSGFQGVHVKNEFDFKLLPLHVEYKTHIKIPLILYLLPSSTFGCPDCYDQCGLFLQIYGFGFKKTFDIDPNSIPFYLANTIDESESVIKEIKGNIDKF